MAVHTHYDNLKVTRSAPLEVIRAAYRAMAQKYHPDMNPAPGATNVMRILNEAWEVLSDPVKRAAHDTWIAEQEALEAKQKQAGPQNGSSTTWSDGARTYAYERERSTANKQPHAREGARRAAESARASNGSAQTQTSAPAAASKASLGVNRRVGIVVAALAAFWWFGAAGGFSWIASHLTTSRTPNAALEAAATRPSEPNFARCAGSYEPEKCRQDEQRLASETPQQTSQRRAALEADAKRARELVQAAKNDSVLQPPPNYVPSGNPAPAPTPPAYVPFTGEVDVAENPALLRGPSRHLGKVLARGGRSSVEIDNANGSGDTEVRLYREGIKPHVRAMLVRKGTSFNSTGIAPGTYVVRWRVLGSQRVYEADQHANLVEEETDRGIRFSKIRMTLYQVRDGNMRTSTVPESEF